MDTIGTILPTAKSLKINDQYAKDLATRQQTVANRKLSNCDKQLVGGEVRYYSASDRYAIVGRDLKVRRFIVRADGDYAIRSDD